jgi:clan AA aspartic protease
LILGHVNYRNEAVIPIHVRDVGGLILTLDAVVDTGFSGYLTLPLATITALQLPFIETRSFSLGNNDSVDFDLYAAVMQWDGTDTNVLVLSSEAHPLVGMSRLKGFRVCIEAIDGGEVRIEPHP